MSLPPLNALRAFEAAGRHNSFAKAAEELHVSPGAISHQVKLLEERVGNPLFKRGPRGVTLTEAGRRLVPRITESFEQLRAALGELNETRDGVLRVTSATTFAYWLLPRLREFDLAHPGIAVRLDVSAELADFSRGQVDVGIRTGHGQWPGLITHGILPAAYTPMLSPRLLATSGPLREPADLLKLPLIDPSDDWWLDWFAEAGVRVPDLSGQPGFRVLLDSQQLASRAALSGLGVAILMPALFAEELGSGQLVQPFPVIRQTTKAHYWLVYAESRRRTPKIRAFRDWLLKTANACTAADVTNVRSSLVTAEATSPT